MEMGTATRRRDHLQERGRGRARRPYGRRRAALQRPCTTVCAGGGSDGGVRPRDGGAMAAVLAANMAAATVVFVLVAGDRGKRGKGCGDQSSGLTVVLWGVAAVRRDCFVCIISFDFIS
ncbi:hypothetical protein SESBI_19690 [Sesbania bispinosa]|nr:hypothetical protein SESBI_19690 [Sesbania bispinosa]